jgi:glycine amidinotransferase
MRHVKVINSNTSFGKLKQVVVGRELEVPERITDITFRAFYQKSMRIPSVFSGRSGYTIDLTLIQKRNRQLNELADTLVNLGVTVHRPKTLASLKEVRAPSFTSLQNSASNVRDVNLVYKDFLIETPPSLASRYFENLLLYEVFDSIFNDGKGGHWVRCPHTELSSKTLDTSYWRSKRDYSNVDKRYVMAIDGAQFVRIGKDCIVNINSYNHWKGFQWIKSFFPETEFHVIHTEDNHLDGDILCLKPGVFLLNPEAATDLRSAIPDKFKSWKYLIPEDLTDDIDVTGMTDIELRIASSAGMDMNVFSVDENTVIVNKRATGVKDILDKNGFSIVEVELDNGEVFGGGIHCSTLDIERDDEYIFY